MVFLVSMIKASQANSPLHPAIPHVHNETSAGKSVAAKKYICISCHILQPVCFTVNATFVFFLPFGLRVPTATEVEKWKESFNHVMSSESESFPKNLSPQPGQHKYRKSLWTCSHSPSTGRQSNLHGSHEKLNHTEVSLPCGIMEKISARSRDVCDTLDDFFPRSC